MQYLIVVVIVLALLLGAALGFGSCGGSGGVDGGGPAAPAATPTAEPDAVVPQEAEIGILVRDRSVLWQGEAVTADEAAKRAKAAGPLVRVQIDPTARMGTVAELERALRDAGVESDRVDLPR